MNIPASLQFYAYQDATAAAEAIADGMPSAWHQKFLDSGKSILASMEKVNARRQITDFGTDSLRYMRFLVDISPDARIFTVNALAPLFMLPDGSPTDAVRRTMSQGIVKFSGLSFEFSE